MKLHRTLIMGAGLLLASCSPKSVPHKSIVVEPLSVVMTDTVTIRDTVFQDRSAAVFVHDTVFLRIADSALVAERDSLFDALLITRYKLERVDFYRRIVNRNRSQGKFLLGWLNRVFQL